MAVHDLHRCRARGAHFLHFLRVYLLRAWLPLRLVRILGTDFVVKFSRAVLRFTRAPGSVLFLLYP